MLQRVFDADARFDDGGGDHDTELKQLRWVGEDATGRVANGSGGFRINDQDLRGWHFQPIADVAGEVGGAVNGSRLLCRGRDVDVLSPPNVSGECFQPIAVLFVDKTLAAIGGPVFVD